MRTSIRAVLRVMLTVWPGIAAAQVTPSQYGTLPSDVRREVVDRYNGANEFRSSGRTEIGAAQDIRGNVSVLGGPLLVSGRITGNVLVINGDVILQPSARIHGDLLVVGGAVEGRSSAQIEGTTRIYRQVLDYRQDGDKIVDPLQDTPRWDEDLRRVLAELKPREQANWTEILRVVQAGPYNRTEGLPIQLGPSLSRHTAWGSVSLDAAAVVRTGSTFQSDKGDVGHKVRTEVRFGHERGIGVGARVFNVVDPIERWQISDLETALAAFLVRRDYRDYYERHGGNGYVTLFGERNLSLTGSFGEERWTSRVAHNPMSVFNGEQSWRANPSVDEGLFHIADLALKLDTRTDPEDPWSGWYADADLEHGHGSVSSQGLRSDGRIIGAGTSYTRALFDVRRYNRLGPNAQLNMRIVFGGWVDGSPMPLERRLSVDGPGTIPGYGFRARRDALDVGTCNRITGAAPVAAECDRIALAQIEYRGDLNFDFTRGWMDWPRRYRGSRRAISWVLFADAGRGWHVNAPYPVGTAMSFSNEALPPLSSFRSDLGVGLDVAGIGLYAAKTTSAPSEPVKFFARLHHRF
jgi:hypothetical protein